MWPLTDTSPASIPEDGYTLRPSKEERTFGQWVAHVADAQAGSVRYLRSRLFGDHGGQCDGAGLQLRRYRAARVGALREHQSLGRVLWRNGCLSAIEGARAAIDGSHGGGPRGPGSRDVILGSNI